MTEPTTEAGRALLDSLALPWLPGSRGYEGMVESSRPAILAIEAEARAKAEHDRLLAIHEALTNIPSLRLTGEQLDALPDGTNREDFFVDVDEHEDWLPLSIVEAVVDRAALASETNHE